jgi:hypothetical protein
VYTFDCLLLVTLQNKIIIITVGAQPSTVGAQTRTPCRSTVGAQPTTPCRSLFKKLDILPIPCQYIFSLMNFILNNQEQFTNKSIYTQYRHSNKHHLHRPNANLSCFQKSTVYSMPVSQFSTDSL